MRVALCADENWILEIGKRYFDRCRSLGLLINGICFLDHVQLLESLRMTRYQMVLIYAGTYQNMEEAVICEIQRICRGCLLGILYGNPRPFLTTSSMKYRARFNGQDRILDMQDISWIESYNRKTSVVMGKKRFRIQGKLDDEEQRLPKELFVRVNRYTIVNLQYIHYVDGKKIHMYNGAVLEASTGRNKNFMERYEDYIEGRFVVL